MFVAYPSVFLWRTIGRKLLNTRDPFEAAREYIQVIKLAMHEAQLSKAERLYQWRSVFQKLRDELHVGVRPQPLTQAELAATIGQVGMQIDQAITGGDLGGGNGPPSVPMAANSASQPRA